MSLDDIVGNAEMDLNEVLSQYYDNENDVPTFDSQYLDVDDLKSLANINFQTCAYSYIHLNIRSLPDKCSKLQLLLADFDEDHRD